MSYVYIQSEKGTYDTPGLWTVGHYGPDGKWYPQSDHGSEAEAITRTAMLNGFPSTSARDLLVGAMHALRSYQYGNSATELAKATADKIEAHLNMEDAP